MRVLCEMHMFCVVSDILVMLSINLHLHPTCFQKGSEMAPLIGDLWDFISQSFACCFLSASGRPPLLWGALALIPGHVNLSSKSIVLRSGVVVRILVQKDKGKSVDLLFLEKKIITRKHPWF